MATYGAARSNVASLSFVNPLESLDPDELGIPVTQAEAKRRKERDADATSKIIPRSNVLWRNQWRKEKRKILAEGWLQV